MSFKPGDKVKLVKNTSAYSNAVGTEGTVVGHSYSDMLEVSVNGYVYTWHEKYTKLIKDENNMSKVKYYRNLKDNFLWDAGAILSDEVEADGYAPINDLWNKTDHNESEYISRRIVEAEENSDMFERVYPIGDIKKMLFGNREAAKAAMSAGAYKAAPKKKK